MKIYLDYLKYWLKAKNAHHLHSPFLYHLYTEVLWSDKYYYRYKDLDKFRRQFKRQVRQKTCPPKLGWLLFELVDNFRPRTIVEFGTGLGISTVYMLSAAPQAQVFTLEPFEKWAEQARQTFQQFNYQPNLLVGNIDPNLDLVLKSCSQIDLILIDLESSNLNSNLNFLRPKIHIDTVIIINNIQSENFKHVWQRVKNCSDVTLSVDLFRVGLLFFRERAQKEDWCLRF